MVRSTSSSQDLLGCKIDFNDARIRRDGEFVQSRIARGCFAFDDNRRPQFGDSGFDPGDEIEIIFGRLDGRHKDMQPAIAWLDAESRADDARRAFALDGAAIRVEFFC